MKRFRVLLTVIICVLGLGLCAAVPVCAAAKKTYRNRLVKVKIKGSHPTDYNYYYYNKKGKKLKNAWKKVKVGGKKKKLYFGKSGKAYKAAKTAAFKYNVAVKKVKGVQYGFGTDGGLLTGIYVSAGFDDGKFYYFNKSGKLNKAVTEKLQKAAAQGSDAKTLRTLLKKYAGKPKSTFTTNACTLYEDVMPESVTVERYSRFEAQYYTMPDGSEIVYVAAGLLS